MEKIQQIKSNWYKSVWWKKKVVPYLTRKIHQFPPRSGIDIPDEEWDNLVILDACRYDMFEQQSNIDGKLTKRTSKGSNTPEFLHSNFKGRDLNDTVYVTANPQINVHLTDEFFKVINIWEEYWDEDRNTVLPDVMADETIKAYETYPNKRLIAHFIQPHYPFIGDIGQNKLNTHSGMELSKRMATGEDAYRNQQSIWEQLYEGTVQTDTVWDAYKENLDIALLHVERLVDVLDEYTVVTSDHGNALGERSWPFPTRIYGHPLGIRMPALTDVPWLIINENVRKEIIAEESSQADIDDQEKVLERLEDLGYK
jgi:hypothetical protein